MSIRPVMGIVHNCFVLVTSDAMLIADTLDPAET
jgi:hypothetical protein